VNPLAVSGDIIVAGSSTVYPLTERMAERFIEEGYAGNITDRGSIGTGAGFERFCVAGETDISNACACDQGSEIEELRCDRSDADSVSCGDRCVGGGGEP
jgi:ABC-type phosphate transport system substrate-binding protein